MESKGPQLQSWSSAKLRKKPLVLVTWRDITSTHTDWFDSTEGLTTAIVKTPGWILEETDKHIIMVSTIGWHDKEGLLSFDTVIPKGCVDQVTVLKKQWWR